MDIDFGLQPKQTLFWEALHDNGIDHICYGGSRKGGKSYVGRAASVFRRLAFPGSFGLLMRETMPEVEANHQEQILQLVYEWGQGGLECSYNVNDAVFTFPQFRRGRTPSKLFLGYGKTLDHVRRYMGNPYLDIFWDEATNFPKEVVTRTNGSLANEYWPETVTKDFYTCNPGGPGAGWVLEDFVEEASRRPRSVFIQAFVDDNQIFLRSDPNFKARLRDEYRDQPWIIEQWLEGNWNASPTSFFAFDSKPGGRHVRHIEVPYWAQWFAHLDAGYYPDPFAVVWAAKWEDVDGGLHLHCVKDYKAWRLELDEQAKKVREIERTIKGLNPELRRFADWSTGHRIPSESAQVTKTTKRIWQKHGLNTQTARKWGRLDGWMLIRYLLAHNEMTMDPGCRALIQEMRDAQHAKVGGQVGSDLDDATGDHNLDCIRAIACQTIGLKHMQSETSDWDEMARAA
jgi:hypothetical protein